MKASLNVKGIEISTIDAVNIAKFIRGKELKKVRAMLEKIKDMKQPLPHLKYAGSTAHKSGKMMAGSYPQKAVGEVLKLLDSVEANAKNKGMMSPFIIAHVKADNGGLIWHHGRKRRERRKNTNFEIMLEEQKSEAGRKTAEFPLKLSGKGSEVKTEKKHAPAEAKHETKTEVKKQEHKVTKK